MPGHRRTAPAASSARSSRSRSSTPTSPSPRRPRRRPAPPAADSPALPLRRRLRRAATPSMETDGSTTPDSSLHTVPTRSRSPAQAGWRLKVYLPVPPVLRCPKRGCGSSYAGPSWTSRVQSVRRHLEKEHGFLFTKRSYVCSVCDETLTPRPSAHPCLSSVVAVTGPMASRHRCVRCPQVFPSARGLRNHERWHDNQDATTSARPRRSSDRVPARAEPRVRSRVRSHRHRS